MSVERFGRDITDHDHIMLLNVNVANLKQGAQETKQMLDKLDVSIEKLTDITHDISKILAVHEERIASHDKIYMVRDSDIREKLQDIAKSMEKYASRVSLLERYFWIAFGGVTLISILLTAANKLQLVF